jgi:acetyl/propionyl-CoA carboxylase alpha subunit
MRFDRDLVADQLEIAAGARVIEPPSPRGAAIECRINAEDAAHDFRPATGTAIRLTLPAGPGVRVDTHLAAGADITPHYDSLIAKVICHGQDRKQARRRMVQALEEFSLLGVRNTAAFLRDVIASEPFTRADLSTRFIAEHFPRWKPAGEPPREVLIAAALAGEFAADGVKGALARNESEPAEARSPWIRMGNFELWGRR